MFTPVKDLTGMVKELLLKNHSNESIKDKLMAEGLTDYQCYLTYIGGKMLATSHVEWRVKKTEREMRLNLETPQAFVPHMPPRTHS